MSLKLKAVASFGLSILILLLILPVALAVALMANQSGGGSCGANPAQQALLPFVATAHATGVSDSGPPPQKFIPIYQAAAAKFQLGPEGPSVLAAIHDVETGYHDSGGPPPNSAGAEGPMQFLPSTWSSQGQDGNGDGKKDIMNVSDAIFGSANYLRNSGAPGNWQKAIFTYNHATWYVDGVLALSKKHHVPDTGGAVQNASSTCTGTGDTASGNGTYVYPLSKDLKCPPSRSDMGVDIECPASAVGKPILAIGDGEILHIQPMENRSGDPNSGFGPTWMSYRLTSGPNIGKTVFIGHSGPPLVTHGKVTAGQPLIMIKGYAASPGHIEIGWGNKDGSNTQASSHYKEGDCTEEGQDFRKFLSTLDPNHLTKPGCQ